jgi:hypothetical protein
MLEDQAAVGVVGLMLVVGLGWVALRQANIFAGMKLPQMLPNVIRLLRSQFAIISMLFVMLALLIYGIAKIGLVNSLSGEGHVERNRENNRMIITEDKDGCMDMRTLGRSNGVYLSIKPCKPSDGKTNPPQ